MRTVNRISKPYSKSWHASLLSKPYLSTHKPYWKIPIYRMFGV